MNFYTDVYFLLTLSSTLFNDKIHFSNLLLLNIIHSANVILFEY